MGGWWSLSHWIKRCLSESNPVKRGVSGRMMGHLFNEVCQQRLPNIQSLISWPLSEEAQTQLSPQNPHLSLSPEKKKEEEARAVTGFALMMKAKWCFVIDLTFPLSICTDEYPYIQTTLNKIQIKMALLVQMLILMPALGCICILCFPCQPLHW